MIKNIFIVFADSKLNAPKVAADQLLGNLLGLALWGIGIMAVIVIIYSAVQIVTARGDVEKAAKGRRTIVWGIVGLMIVLLAGVITSVVTNTAGEI